MKQWLGILLLFCLLVPPAGTYLELKRHKKQVRKEVKRQMIAGIDENALVRLAFTLPETQTQLRWEHAKEFEYRGQMYDIVSAETCGDSVFYLCWWDHAETALNRQLKSLVVHILGKDPQNQEKQERLIAYFQSLYFLAKAQQPFLLLAIVLAGGRGAAHDLFPAYPPPSPPPQS